MRKNKNRILILIISGLLSILLILLVNVEMNTSKQASKKVFIKDHTILAEQYLKTAENSDFMKEKTFEESVISNIQNSFDTNSSEFWLLARNDEIIYLKDENTSAMLQNERLSDLKKGDNKLVRYKQKYLYSYGVVEIQGATYELGLCVKEEYWIRQHKYNSMYLNCMIYFVLFVLVESIIIILSFYGLRSARKEIRELKQECKQSRLLIDKLQHEMDENYVDPEQQGYYSIYHKSVLEEVMNKIEKEKEKDWIVVDIFIEKLEMENFVATSIVLDRIHASNSIASYWGDNRFKVLLPHCNRKKVKGFINLFTEKYQVECKGKIEDIKFVVSELKGNSYEV